MAVYKVPQDVEAEDKLIGPFSFRQFIYLIVAALGIFMAWLLAQVFIGLVIIPLPIVFAFLALALPLRKDQPMETYLIAMIKFFFKPRRRLWDPEGTISMVQITAPRVLDGPQLKEYGGAEASERLGYLAQVLDTKGWSTRGATSASDNLSDIFVAEASHAEDVLDEKNPVAQSLDQRMAQANDARLQAAREQMKVAAVTPVAASDQSPVASSQPAVSTDETPLATDNQQPDAGDTPELSYNPYPNAIHQHVLNPDGSAAPTKPTPPVPAPAAEPKQAVPNPVSPDIMRLANNNDLSISALSREAHRLGGDDDEVVISLR